MKTTTNAHMHLAGPTEINPLQHKATP